MFTYTDLNGCGVELSFKQGVVPVKPTHVLMLAKYEGKWILTDHPMRGIEFPGGKLEQGETLEQAAIREAYEETGAIIKAVEWLATYYVQHQQQPFAKAVFIATADSVEPNFVHHETNGLVLMSDDELFASDNLSFYMKDLGMKKMLEKVREREA
ncbi:MAG: NUDIX domain-containing protein [Kurthia sp.]|nr:NUDIX domain-containing protein [Candidatus Kurthia equi]